MANQDRTVREGQPIKRAAILVAARELFLRDGFERTSMDAIAGRARVSKRTVYDYFGDKTRLLVAVVEDAGDSLWLSLRTALMENLSDERPIRTVADLERSLVAFAMEIGTTIINSADYSTVFTLIAEQRSELSELENRLVLSRDPEDAIAERFAHFHEVGLLEAPDSRLAADHFNALTALLAYSNQPTPSRADPERVRRTMTEGVHVFMRAYGARPDVIPPTGR